MSENQNKLLTTYIQPLNIFQFTLIFESLKKKDPTFTAKVINAYYEEMFDIYTLHVEFPTKLKQDIDDILYE